MESTLQLEHCRTFCVQYFLLSCSTGWHNSYIAFFKDITQYSSMLNYFTYLQYLLYYFVLTAAALNSAHTA